MTPHEMRCHRGMYAFIAGSYGSAGVGFTLIYQAGLAGQRISAFTRFPRFSHAPFPFAFRFQVGEMTRRPYSSVPPFSARRISSWVKWRTSSAYLAKFTSDPFAVFTLGKCSISIRSKPSNVRLARTGE